MGEMAKPDCFAVTVFIISFIYWMDIINKITVILMIIIAIVLTVIYPKEEAKEDYLKKNNNNVKEKIK